MESVVGPLALATYEQSLKDLFSRRIFVAYD